MRKFKWPVLIVLGMIFLFSNCTYHNEVDYFNVTTNQCDTVNMSFQTDVYPVISANCLACHSNSSAAFSVTLEGYDNVKKRSKNLLDAIEHKAGVPPMPQGSAKLSDCTINKINAWVNQGLKNN